MQELRKILLFGGSGQIGGAVRLCAALRSSVLEIRTFPWSVVAQENLCEDLTSLRVRIDEATDSWMGTFDILFANGLTDPKASVPLLTRSNVTFPLAVIQATQNLNKVRYLTIGTVFEEFSDFALANPYVACKRQLCARLLAQTALVDSGRVMHLRLHTLYGDRPKPHMFLGQIVDALEQGIDFRMSSGEQLREYHHVHDIGGSILTLLEREWQPGTSPLHLSSGLPIRLVDLAKAVFAECGRTDLLKIGEIPVAEGDNQNRIFPRSDTSTLPYFRDPILGVLEYIRHHFLSCREAAV